MAAYISTRNSIQCKSHFQKKLLKFKTVSYIKNHYKRKISIAEYEAKREDLLKQKISLSPQLKPRKFFTQILSEEKEVQTDFLPEWSFVFA